jgi:hypothetical protein
MHVCLSIKIYIASIRKKERKKISSCTGLQVDPSMLAQWRKALLYWAWPTFSNERILGWWGYIKS